MRCIACSRYLIKSASPSMVIGPVCLRKAMPQPKRQPKGEGKAVPVLPGQLKLELGEGLVNV
jgi:hypothetical protein